MNRQEGLELVMVSICFLVSRKRLARVLIKIYLFEEFGKSVNFILNFTFDNLWHSASAEFETQLQSDLFTKLSWTHIRHLLRVSDSAARDWYITEATSNSWSVRILDRNIATQYYQRRLASQIQEPVIEEMEKASSLFQKDTFEFVKNPSMLEFLNLPREVGLTESNIETAIINNLHQFLLELGKGFAFVERQKLIRTET